jgi:Ca2+-binding EF-hand superfamily protein
MTVKLSVNAVAVLVSAFSVIASNFLAQSNSKEPNRPVVVGTLKSVDSSGTRFDVQQSDEDLRKLYVNSESKVYFVGLPAKGEQKPRAGLGVKAICEKDGRVKTISFTPPVEEPSMLGVKRLTMTESELFKEVDKNVSESISYIEFDKYIYHSPKHGPDSFRKADKDSDGVLDTTEFVESLSKVSWWKLSRKTPGEWFIQADKNRNYMLDIKEFAWICTSANHIENIFKRTDRDDSGSLTQRETEAYIHSVTHGKHKNGMDR